MTTPAGAHAMRPFFRTRRRGWLLGAVRVALAAGVVGYLLHVVPVRDVVARFEAVAPPWVALALLLQLVSLVLAAASLAMLLRPQGLAVAIPRILAISLASAFYNLVTPAGTLAGGAVRWYRLGYRVRRMPEVLAALVTSRMLEMAMLAGLVLAGWLWAPVPGSAALLGAVPGLLFAVAALAYAGLFSRRLALRLIVLLRRLVPDGGTLRRLALRFLLATRAQAGLSGGRHGALVVLTLLRHVAAVGTIYVLAGGLGLDVGFAALLWVRSLTTMLIMLPVSFAGLGVREATFVVLLQPYGLAPSEALPLALAASALALVPAVLGGLLELLRVADHGAGSGSGRVPGDAR